MTALAEAAPDTGTNIVALVEASPVIVLTDKAKYSAFYEAMKAECDAHVPDLSTETSRKKIASLAYKVARTKTAIDDAGKKLNEEARARINAVDESRREIRQQLDALKDEVRRPLTEWEEAEATREMEARAELESIRNMARVDFDDSASDVQERIDALTAMTISADLHGEMTGVAGAARTDAIAALTAAHERLQREEQERAELERLRAEAAEREQQEIARREQEAEAERVAAVEKAEQERVAQLEREAEERAKAEAERVAREERAAADKAHAEALAAERARAEEAERAAQAERERAAADEAARKEAVAREAAAQAAREKDREHRGKIMGAAKEGIMEAGSVLEPVAKAIVLAIAAGSVPNVSIRF